MQPIDNVFGKFPRVVRELAKKLGKQIELTMKGNEVELDKTILESLADPLTHLIRNCCDHGLEEAEVRTALGKPAIGRVWLSAYHEGGLINIEIKDDGRGIDPEALKEAAVKKGLKTEAEVAQLNDKEAISLIMLPGFSMARKVSDVSGRGVGMDVVKTNLEKLGGAVDIESRLGEGTIVHLRLPLTLAIIPCLIVMVGNYRYAIPQVNLEELVALYDQDVLTKLEYTGDREVYRLRKRLLPMIRLQEVLARSKPFTDKACAQVTEKYRKLKEIKLADYQAAKKKGAADAESIVSTSLNFVVLKVGADRFGLIVDRVLGTEEIVVKPMHPALKALPCYSGATVMGDGQVALILDIEGISAYAGLRYKAIGGSDDQAIEGRSDEGTQAVLLFKNGAEEQFALALPLIRRIERIDPAGIEPVGDKEFISIDGQSTLILRLDKHLNVSSGVMRDEMFLLLPKHTKRPFGILVSTLLDIAEAPLELNIESYQEPGLLGTAIIRDHITLFIDMYRLIEKAEPGWFGTPAQKNSGGKAVHILLAEDSPFFRQMIRGYLEDNGYQVTVAENGKIALNFLNENQFDLIVSDLEMPEMNGWEFMQEVRSGSNQRDIPSLALTSLESGKHRDRALQVGFNRYEVKIDRLRLLEAVDNLLHEKS
ncbi:MAG: hypothetical protein A2521_13490 [Deltaproteobacteria bacterium RIFOXYD12_FULL_57_12]|nr:MAG: hypothetical protein A2521_13490 [Deltaproteobacteria bacterium RIFOXYD12_FULL_57_12]